MLSNHVDAEIRPMPMPTHSQGDFSVSGAWIYISLAVNLSVCYAFYCLGMFYYVLKVPLKPFDPVPKFLCIKAVLFLSYWQVRYVVAIPRDL